MFDNSCGVEARPGLQQDNGLKPLPGLTVLEAATGICGVPAVKSNRDASFWSMVAIRGDNDCWEWKGATRRGYGRYGRRGVASRYALVLATGQNPPDLYALHSCDNRPCCNPKHLRWGTHADNAQDKMERGRWAGPASQSGAANGHAKLTDDGLAKVVDRLQRGWDNSRCAQGLPIGHSMVSKIRVGKMWREQSAALGWVPTPGTPKRNARNQVPA